MDNEQRTDGEPRKPELQRPPEATKDLEPDEHEVEQVKGGHKLPIKYT